jgi:hypothetical protein
MIARGNGGSIVNISSQASQSALKDHTVYCKWIEFIVYCTFAPRSPMALFPCLLVLVIYPHVLCANIFLYVPFLSWAQSPSYSFQTYCAQHIWHEEIITVWKRGHSGKSWCEIKCKWEFDTLINSHPCLTGAVLGNVRQRLSSTAARNFLTKYLPRKFSYILREIPVILYTQMPYNLLIFFTLLGFLCSYWGIYSIFPSNNPSNIHLQCLCSTKNEKKQHHEGNMALRIISILTH